MPDFLTRRNGTWHFVRRVPAEFAALDHRGIIRHSTKVRVTSDRTGRMATRVADRFNAELEAHWRHLAGGHDTAASGYEDARRRARALGFEYVDVPQLVALPFEKRFERIEALITTGLANDAGARAALLGTQPKPSFLLSQLFEEFEAATKDETKDLSRNQLRVWRNGRIRVAKEFVEIAGDKPVTEITDADGMDYCDWWRERVIAGEVSARSANKSIGALSRMLKLMSVRRRFRLPEIFKGLRLAPGEDKSRSPYEAHFIQNTLLATGALDGLNDEARHILYVCADTGLRPSEVANLQPGAIHLDASIPYVEVLPIGRKLKTQDSEREVPLVGVALAAMKLHAHGFPRYRDKACSLSGLVNKFLSVNGYRPTKYHSVYSLRHSFKDRLIAVEAPDAVIDNLMGHRRPGPRYGNGASLELKLKYLELIAFKPPSRL